MVHDRSTDNQSGGFDASNPGEQTFLQRLTTAVKTGAGAFLVTVALAVGWVWSQDPTSHLADHGFDSSGFSHLPDTNEMVLWALFQGHNVDIAVEQSVNDPEASAIIADVTVVGPGPLVVLVPLVLGVAGAYCAFDLSPSSAADAALTGAAVVLGYLPATLFSIWLAWYDPSAVTFGIEGSADQGPALLGEDWAVGFSIYPDPRLSAVVAGILYPVFWSGLGALIVYLLLSQFSE